MPEVSLTATLDTMGQRLLAANGNPHPEEWQRQHAADGTGEVGQAGRRRSASLWPVRATAVSLASLPIVRSADGGPNSGYFWAVQRITIGPIGALTDLVTAYRGYSTADVQPQNALNSFTGTIVGQFVCWIPGGAGAIMLDDESLVFAGTITGTNPMASMDAVQGELSRLTDYLD